MQKRTIYFETNYNGKLATERFLHIDLAPPSGSITEPVMAETIIEIITRDGSHDPIQAQLVDVARITKAKLKDLPSWCSWCSHGMHSWDLYSYFFEKYPKANKDTEFCIYFYQKTKV